MAVVQNQNARDQWGSSAVTANGGLRFKRGIGFASQLIDVNQFQQELCGRIQRPSSPLSTVNTAKTGLLMHSLSKSYTNRGDNYGFGIELEQLVTKNNSSETALDHDYDPKRTQAANQKSDVVHTLGDLFTCPATSFPMTVGLFSDASSSLHNDTLEQLNLEIKSIIAKDSQTQFSIDFLLIATPSLVIILFSYLLGIFFRWEVGLAVCLFCFFLALNLLILLIVVKAVFHWNLPPSFQHSLMTWIRELRLLINFMFYYPKRGQKSNSPVKIQIVRFRLSNSQNTPYVILVLIVKMWEAVDRNYNRVVVRLQRFMHRDLYPVSSKRNLKRICCLPAHFVLASIILAININFLLIRIKSFDMISLLTDTYLLPVFVVMNSIIFLSVCASVPILFNALVALIYRPTTPLMKAVKYYSPRFNIVKSRSRFVQRIINHFNHHQSINVNQPTYPQSQPGYQFVNGQTQYNTNANPVNGIPSMASKPSIPVISTCETDLLIKQEFGAICDIIQAFNYYLQKEQTRLIILLDAQNITCPVQLAGIFYQIHSLLLTQPNAPIAFVVASDIKALFASSQQHTLNTVITSQVNEQEGSKLPETTDMSTMMQNVADAAHLVQHNINLPIFLDPFIFPKAIGFRQYFQHTYAVASNGNSSIINNNPTAATLNTGSSNDICGTPLSVKQKGGLDVGQINGAFNSIEELDYRARKVSRVSANAVTTGVTPSIASHLSAPITSTPITTSKPPQVVATANSIRIATLKANSMGIDKLFLTPDEFAEQNVKVLKHLVSRAAFANRVLILSRASISINQLITWVYLTYHWPYHLSWLMEIVEESTPDISETDPPESTQLPEPFQQHGLVLFNLTKKAMMEIAMVPPVAVVLSWDDRDPVKLLEFVHKKTNCEFTIDELRRLISLSIFVNPYIRALIKEIRQWYFNGKSSDLKPPSLDKAPSTVIKTPGFHISPSGYPINHCLGSSNTTQDNSSGETRSPLPVSFDFDATEKGLCFVNPVGLSAYPACPIRLKNNLSMTLLSKMNADEVCSLLASIAEIPVENCTAYQMHVRQQNITGSVLSVCDLEKLRYEIKMNFGDWQLFDTCILYLRRIEASYRAHQRKISETKSSSQLETDQLSSNLHNIVMQRSCEHNPGKNTFDVPILVQEYPTGERPRHRLETSSTQFQDRTISDLSFGSAAEEMEYVWKRDVQPDSLNPISQKPEFISYNDAFDSHSRANFQYFRQKSAPTHGCQIAGTSSFDNDRRHNSGKNRIGHAVPVWLDQEGKPLYGFSKSTTDLRPENKIQYKSSIKRQKISSRKRMKIMHDVVTSKSSIKSKHRSSSQGAEEIKIIPNYIPNQLNTEKQPGYIPLWYPTLSCVGEYNKQSADNDVVSDISSQSSIASANVSYEFPSDCSSSGQYYIHPKYTHAPPSNAIPDNREHIVVPASEYQFIQAQNRSPKSFCSTPSRNAPTCHGNCSISSYEPSGHIRNSNSRASSRQSNNKLERLHSRKSSRGQTLIHQCMERRNDTPDRHQGFWMDSHGRGCGKKQMEGCTCDYFLYMEEGENKDVKSLTTSWSQSHKISSPDLSDIEAMTSS